MLCEEDELTVLLVAGLQAELFYVRDGVINEYALNFVVPVPAHLGSLHFTWQSLVGRPVSITLHYTRHKCGFGGRVSC